MTITRRSFFRRALGALATAAIAPFIPQPPITLFGGEFIAPNQIRWMMNMQVLSPRMTKMFDNIAE